MRVCGRFLLDESPELRPIIEEMNRSPLLPLFGNAGIVMNGEIRPSMVVPAVAFSRAGKRTVFPMKWGFQGKSGLMINARTETAAEKALFREAWRAHRCAVPAGCYYEWEHLPGANGKKALGPKYAIRPAGAAITWLCGLYRIENGAPAFVILTREPAAPIRFIHDRMPFILPDADVDEWIRPDAKPEALLPLARQEMIFEKVV
jgi:putative SOS response-associated peptidase YedK